MKLYLLLALAAAIVAPTSEAKAFCNEPEPIGIVLSEDTLSSPQASQPEYPYNSLYFHDKQIRKVMPFHANGKLYELVYVIPKIRIGKKGDSNEVYNVFLIDNYFINELEPRIKTAFGPTAIFELIYHDLGDDSKSFCGLLIREYFPPKVKEDIVDTYISEIRIPDEVAQDLMDFLAGETKFINKTSIKFVETNSPELRKKTKLN